MKQSEVGNSICDQERDASNVPGDTCTCIVCKNSRAKDPDASFHCLPMEPTWRCKWLRALHLEEHEATPKFAVGISLEETENGHCSIGFKVAFRLRLQISKPAPFFPENTCKGGHFFRVQLRTPHAALARSERRVKKRSYYH